jgi:hypothetical protein
MPNLVEVLTADSKKNAVIDDCIALIDAEVAAKSGLMGFAIKAGYKTIQGIKPGFVRGVVTDLLPEFATTLDPLYQEGKGMGRTATDHFNANPSRVAEALLSITDDKARRSKSGLVKGTYDKLRSSAQRNVEAAVGRLGPLVDKHAS